jgi:hypothetical protein
MCIAYLNQLAIVIEKRICIVRLYLYIDIPVIRVERTPRLACSEARVFTGIPLHGQANVLVGLSSLHTDFFAVIKEWSTGRCE